MAGSLWINSSAMVLNGSIGCRRPTPFSFFAGDSRHRRPRCERCGPSAFETGDEWCATAILPGRRLLPYEIANRSLSGVVHDGTRARRTLLVDSAQNCQPRTLSLERFSEPPTPQV